MEKKFIRIIANLWLIIFLISIIACPVTPDSPEDLDLFDNPVIEENSLLFELDADTGVISFNTNDSKYISEYGYTLWAENNEIQSPFTGLNVTLSKIDGNSDAGYGVVFCSYDDTMLVVLINTKKEFVIGELTGTLFTVLQEWTEAASLNSGLNQINVINITFVAGEFFLTFNAGETIVFSDTEEPYHSYGKDGYLVVISPLDNFPNVPVSVTFKKN